MSDQSKYYTVVKDYNGKEVANVHTGMLAKSLTLENMAELLQDFVNSGMKDYRDGEVIGKLLQSSHRTLQASVIRLCLGIMVSLSKQDYTDARNVVPVEMCKEIAKMLEDGKLSMGYMI
jgi:hypothetical protein